MSRGPSFRCQAAGERLERGLGNDGRGAPGEFMRPNRAQTLENLMDRLRRGVDDGKIPTFADLHAVARFAQTVQAGMSILARDGASGIELAEVADLSMLGWDARLRQVSGETARGWTAQDLRDRPRSVPSAERHRSAGDATARSGAVPSRPALKGDENISA